MKEAKKHMQEILALLRKRGFVPMLDFDGVLAPIVKRPQDARMAPRAGKALIALKERMQVAIISGRTLESVRAQAALPGVIYAGSHGVELAMSGKLHVRKLPPRVMKRFEVARDTLHAVSEGFFGLIIEEKPHATAVNYRALSCAKAGAFSRAAHAAIAPYVRERAVRVLDHLKTFEIIARGGWTKGEVAKHILKRIGKRGQVPVYIGDSLTDEDAFRALKRGITIRVGRTHDTAAKYFFRRRSEVDSFLERLVTLNKE